LRLTERPGPGREWPRLWWCPVGPLAYLPLHAAGHHSEAALGAAAARTVLDRVISSYTSTIRALAYARRSSGGPPAGSGPPLIVAMPDTLGAPALPGVVKETRIVKGLIPSAAILQGRDATKDSVLAALPQHPVVHFACHGVSDQDDPGRSYLVLHDYEKDPLTVTAISELNLGRADLAYLSACSTADPSPRLPDEALHITSAFQLAGYRNIVGTLWSVLDSPEVAESVYRHLTANGSLPPDTARTATALHRSLTDLRDRGASVTAWCAYIHVGI
jgi:CHAT domain-containing protein